MSGVYPSLRSAMREALSLSRPTPTQSALTFSTRSGDWIGELITTNASRLVTNRSQIAIHDLADQRIANIADRYGVRALSSFHATAQSAKTTGRIAKGRMR